MKKKLGDGPSQQKELPNKIHGDGHGTAVSLMLCDMHPDIDIVLDVVFAQRSDLDDLANMNAELIKAEGHRNSMTLEELRQRMNNWISSSYDAAIFKIDNELAGYALWRNETDYTYLRQFYIQQNLRRQGLGTRAFNYLKNNELAGRRLRLEVLIHNKHALEFWRAVGFSDYCMALEHENT